MVGRRRIVFRGGWERRIFLLDLVSVADTRRVAARRVACEEFKEEDFLFRTADLVAVSNDKFSSLD